VDVETSETGDFENLLGKDLTKGNNDSDVKRTDCQECVMHRGKFSTKRVWLKDRGAMTKRQLFDRRG
jgi:hypothetical protein